ncbi:hypothetical protein CDIK_1887 [Cucumispora dikerogammari]|nr:hypothetical protein CDIK_1887 [Cucumispora dikerogammari]
MFKAVSLYLKQLVVIRERRNCENTIETRFKYVKNLLNLTASIKDKNLIFLNEVCFSVCSRTKKGRALIGRFLTITTGSIRSRNISVIAAANKFGMINFYVNNRPVNGEDFLGYIINLKNICSPKNIQNPILYWIMPKYTIIED